MLSGHEDSVSETTMVAAVKTTNAADTGFMVPP